MCQRVLLSDGGCDCHPHRVPCPISSLQGRAAPFHATLDWEFWQCQQFSWEKQVLPPCPAPLPAPTANQSCSGPSLTFLQSKFL